MADMNVTDAAARAAGLSCTLSPATREVLAALARALARGAIISSLAQEFQGAARAGVADARRNGARAEGLVRELKQEWSARVLSAGLDRHLADKAIERLVTEAIAEFYRSA